MRDILRANLDVKSELEVTEYVLEAELRANRRCSMSNLISEELLLGERGAPDLFGAKVFNDFDPVRPMFALANEIRFAAGDPKPKIAASQFWHKCTKRRSDSSLALFLGRSWIF